MPKHSANIGMCVEERQSPIGTCQRRYFGASILGCIAYPTFAAKRLVALTIRRRHRLT